MTRSSITRVAKQAARTGEHVCLSCLRQRRLAQAVSRAVPERALSSIAREVPAYTKAASQDRSHRVSRRRSRNSSTTPLVSNSAINAPSHLPSQFQDVHSSLARLQDDAAAFVDLSRVQLALKSFERSTPVLRVGFLAVGERGGNAARNLVRLLLCDLLDSAQSWEQELLDTSKDDGRSILIRYGEPEDLAPNNAILRTMIVKSAYLQKHQLEFLITSFQTQFMQDQATPEDIEDALLVPSLTIPASAGRVGFVRNPVHRSIVVAKGIDGAIQLGRIAIPHDRTLLSGVVDVSGVSRASGGALMTIDTMKSTAALEGFRDDIASGSFAEDWVASGIAEVSAYLANDGEVTNFDIAVRYASSTIAATEQALHRAVAADTEKAQSITVLDTTRSELQDAITDWSAEAHNDLRNNLMTAMDSRAWRRTAWYRLLWRIDDVSYSSTDILTQCWLNESEQRLAFLSGRLRQAGLASDTELKENADIPQLITEQVQDHIKSLERSADPKTVAELTQFPTMLSRVHEQSGIDPLFDPPWPKTINLARQVMLHTNVPEMHRKAQSLVLSTLTTIGGSSALSAWLWVATSGVALYECGAIASLGLVWSLRRLQRLWGKERDSFANTVHESGRRVLIEIENQLRQLVRTGGRPSTFLADATTFARARSAITRCREALAKLSQKDI